MELRHWIKYLVFWVVLFLLQIGVFDNMNLGGWGFKPQVLVLFLLLLPFEASTPVILFLAFVTGLLYDSFNASMALNTSAFLVVALMRNFLLKSLEPRNGYEVNTRPSAIYYGLTWFLIYAGISLLFYELIFNILDLFSWTMFFRILVKTIVNTLLSLFFVVLLHWFFLKNRV